MNSGTRLTYVWVRVPLCSSGGHRTQAELAAHRGTSWRYVCVWGVMITFMLVRSPVISGIRIRYLCAEGLGWPTGRQWDQLALRLCWGTRLTYPWAVGPVWPLGDHTMAGTRHVAVVDVRRFRQLVAHGLIHFHHVVLLPDPPHAPVTHSQCQTALNTVTTRAK